MADTRPADHRPRTAPQLPRPDNRWAWPLLLAILATGPLLYGAGLVAAALLDRQPLGQALWFDPAVAADMTPLRLVAAVTVALGAVLTLFVVPWLVGVCALRRIARFRVMAGAWSLAANSAGLVLVCLLLRETVGIQRGTLLVAWLTWTVLWLAATGGAAGTLAEIGGLWRRWWSGLVVGLVTVAVGITLFHREQFLQCFEGDGTEVFELARSLRTHFLPYWEIDELQRFGTVNVYPAMIDSYWTMALQVFLGPGEPATRLPYWVWWLGIFLTAMHLVGAGRVVVGHASSVPRTMKSCATDYLRGPWQQALPLALAVLLIAVFYTFYNGYYPYMTDLASPGVPDAMLTLLVFLALDCLGRDDLAGWAVMLALATLTSYAGPVMLVLSTAAALVWQPVPRRRLLRAACLGASLVGGIFLFYIAWGWREGILGGWWATLVNESFVGYYTRLRPSASAWAFVGYFVLGCGGVPVLGLLLPFRRRGSAGKIPAVEIAWQRTVASVTFGYLLIILGARCKNLHYLGPLLVIPLVLWLRRSPARWPAWTAAAAYLVCLWLCWPLQRPLFTLNREFGALTAFQTDSYEEAVAWSKVVHPLYYRGLMSWELGPHTWVQYSELSARPADLRPFLVSKGPPPPSGYQLLFESPQEVRVYSRDRRWAAWLGDQDPTLATERSPGLLRPAVPIPEKASN